MEADDQPSREELLRAKRDLQEQLDIVSQPIRPRDYNPGLVAKLRAMIADIDECLATSTENASQSLQPVV